MTVRSRVFVLDMDAEQVGRQYSAAGIRCSGPPLLDLARAVAASPAWAKAGEVVLVVREHGTAADGVHPDGTGRDGLRRDGTASDGPGSIGILGSFGPELEAAVQAMAWQLEFSLDRLRYVSYAQVEEDCGRLAGLLAEELGRDTLRDSRFVAIPRGGHVVLSLLSYMLPVPARALDPYPDAKTDPNAHPDPDDPERPLIVVDDCALSGLRFGEFLASAREPQIVFAHLYSHPELRQTIEAREPRVRACVAARDLSDRAAVDMGEGYADWKSLWEKRSDARAYWVGHPEHVCFPWNEPDVSIWNAVSEQAEEGWRVVPPEQCVKNRLAAHANVRVQVQPRGPGPLRPPESVLFGDLNDHLLVADATSGVCLKLENTAADMWREIVRCGTSSGAARALADTYAEDAEVLRADVESFAAELTERGFLEAAPVSGGTIGP